MSVLFANNAASTLAAGITDSATNMTLASGEGAKFPSPSGGSYFMVTIVDDANNIEIVKCTARTTDTLTVVRGQEGTTARAYSTGDKVELRVTAGALAALAVDPIPSGVILMWSGSTGTIPTGWLLCDGTNGTPNLRDRFVVGAGSSYSVGDTGGAVTVTTGGIGGHTHTGITSSAGAHDHGGSTGSVALTPSQVPPQSTASFGIGEFLEGTMPAVSNGAPHAHTISSAGGHTHFLDLVDGGAHDHTVDTRSPYYALCFIMKA